jgi:hypothetical protein
MAIKCDNCERPACYTTADPGVSAAHYCSTCLPHWLHDRAQAGHFPLVDVFDQTPKEDAPTEAPKVKKKASTKAAASEDSN